MSVTEKPTEIDQIDQRRKSILNRELLIAAYNGDEETVQRLMQSNPCADVNFVDDDGNSPLLYAVKSGKVEVVKMLLENGADLLVENKMDDNCVDIAEKNHDIAVALVLNEKLVELTNKNLEGFAGDKRTSRFHENDLTADEINLLLRWELARLSSKHDSNSNPAETSNNKSTKRELGKESMEMAKRDATRIFDVMIWEDAKIEESKIEAKETIFKLIDDTNSSELISLSQEKDLMLIVNNSQRIKGKLEPVWAVFATFGQTTRYTCCIFSPLHIINQEMQQLMQGKGDAIENYQIFQTGSRIIDSATYALQFLEIINEQRENLAELRSKLVVQKNHRIESLESFRDTKRKILFCGRLLQDLPDSRTSEEAEYRKANCLIYFLEAFALSGEGDKELRKIKMDYFTRFYDKADLHLINKIRNLLLKNWKKNIDVKDIGKLFKKEGDWDELLNALKDYVNNVIERMASPGKKRIKEEGQNVRTFLKEKICFESIPDREDSNLTEEFAKLIKAGYEGKGSEKMRFHLLVNIYPSFSEITKTHGDLKELRQLRNKLVHQFDAYDTPEFIKQIKNLRELMYAYELAKNLYHSLNETKLQDSPGKVDKRLRDGIENFQKRFHEDFILPEEDARNFALGGSELLYPAINDMDIEEFAAKYLRFMPIFKNIEIGDLERREIFEGFRTVEHAKEKQGEFKRELVEKYRINPNDYDKVMKLSADGKNNHQYPTGCKKIIEIVKTLKSCQETQKLQLRQVIEYYEYYSNNKPELDYLERMEEIEEMFQRLPKEKEVKVEIGCQAGVTICVVETVANIVKTYSTGYYKHQLNFATIESAFNDSRVVEFLVKKDLDYFKQTESFKLKNNYRVYALIKKMIKHDYAAPYIAQLIFSVEADDVIEKEDFETLMKALVKGKHDLCARNLSKLLSRKNDPFNSYRLVYENLLKGSHVLKKMKVVFQNHDHVRQLFKIINAEIDEATKAKNSKTKLFVKLVKQFLGLLNAIASEFLDEEKPEEALKITKLIQENIFNGIHNKLTSLELMEEHDSIVSEAKLVWAKTELDLHEIVCYVDTKKIKISLPKVQEKLESYLTAIVDNNIINSPLSFRALSLLVRLKFVRMNYKKSWELDRTLYQKISEYVHPNQPVPDIETLTKDVYKRIAKNEKYRHLIGSSQSSDFLEMLGRWAYGLLWYQPVGESTSGEITSDESIEMLMKVLGIHKRRLNISKNIYGQKHECSMDARHKIVLVNNLMADIFRKKSLKRERKNIFYCQYKALIHANILHRHVIKRYGLYSPIMHQQQQYLRQTLLRLKLVHILFAKNGASNKELRLEFLKAANLIQTHVQTEDAIPLDVWFEKKASATEINEKFENLIRMADALASFEAKLPKLHGFTPSIALNFLIKDRF